MIPTSPTRTGGSASRSRVCPYGNASSDICAYAEAGIPADRTFIIGPNAGEACREYPASQAVAGYEQHLRALE